MNKVLEAYKKELATLKKLINDHIATVPDLQELQAKDISLETINPSKKLQYEKSSLPENIRAIICPDGDGGFVVLPGSVCPE